MFKNRKVLTFKFLIVGLLTSLPAIYSQSEDSPTTTTTTAPFPFPAVGSLQEVIAFLRRAVTDSAGNPRLYTGTRVGPFRLFQSSSQNAEIVNNELRGLVLPHAIGLALGDEFPMIRDDFISQTKEGSGLRAFTNFRNWRFDLDNRKKELQNPYLSTTRQLIGELASTVLLPSNNKPENGEKDEEKKEAKDAKIN